MYEEFRMTKENRDHIIHLSTNTIIARKHESIWEKKSNSQSKSV